MAPPAVYSTFFQHYMAYLASPVGMIAIFSLLSLALFVALKTRPQRRWQHDINFPGCARFGLHGRSNLEKQRLAQRNTSSEPRVQALYAYPIKSCRGVELQTTEITNTGFKYDRLFSFAHWVAKKVDKNNPRPDTEESNQWTFLTQRQRPQLAQMTTELWIPDPRLRSELLRDDLEELNDRAVNDWEANGGCVVVRFPHKTSKWGITTTETVTFKLPLHPTKERAAAKGYKLSEMAIWKDTPLALNVSCEIDPTTFGKLKSFLGIENRLALFRIDDNDNLRTVTRNIPKDRTDRKFQVGFADAFPVHLLNIASVQAVDDLLPSTSHIKANLSPVRFRANVYISGAPAFAEDEWKRIILGRAGNPGEVAADAEFHVACRTARCGLPNVDPVSGVRDRDEPFKTMKKERAVDEGAKPHAVLGLSMIPLFERGWLKVGEKLEVLGTGVHVYEKMYK